MPKQECNYCKSVVIDLNRHQQTKKCIKAQINIGVVDDYPIFTPYTGSQEKGIINNKRCKYCNLVIKSKQHQQGKIGECGTARYFLRAESAKNGDLNLIKEIHRNFRQLPFLHMACSHNQLEVAKYIWEHTDKEKLLKKENTNGFYVWFPQIYKKSKGEMKVWLANNFADVLLKRN